MQEEPEIGSNKPGIPIILRRTLITLAAQKASLSGSMIILPEDIMTSFIDHLLAVSKCMQPFLDRCVFMANVALVLEWISKPVEYSGP